MNRILPLRNSPLDQNPADQRLLLGIQVSSDCRKTGGALVRVTGAGLDAQLELVASAVHDVPVHVYARYDTLLRGRMDRPGDAGLIAYGLADIQVAVVDQIFAQQSVSSSDVSALGVHDPGLWHVTPGGCSGYVSLCDAARIAEQTGLCVVDAFPARDLAGGGQGGPITALGLWMVLRDPDQARIFLDLGRTTRLTYLPSSTAASSAASSAARVLAFDIGPGT
ncbi:MAG: anhydro-N-acetylmuramic acid kinase, partial [Pirellulales bacterium]